MAEGDTILRLALRIEESFAGREVSARAPHPRGQIVGIERLNGLTITGAEARGKHLLLRFTKSAPHSGPDEHLSRRAPGKSAAAPEGLVLHSHLGMNGGWHIYRRGHRWRRPQSSAWAVISSEPKPGSADLDLVQFGGPTLRLLRPEQARRDPTLNSLGPDILAPEPFDLAGMVASLRRAEAGMTLGEALLDQRLVAGIGNIFKSEGCFAACIDPWRALDQVSDEELAEVLAATREMMSASVAGAPRPHRVYRRSGQPCGRCRGLIRSRGQGEANRTTFWCAGCQR